MKSQFVRMFEHAAWANQQILQALQSISRQPEKVVTLFAHVLSAEKVWLTRLCEQDSSKMAIWPEFSLAECEKLLAENQAGYAAFLEQITEQDLMKSVAYRSSKGQEFHNSIQDILTHVSLHGSYHRGQISACLRSEGFEPVNTDYIVFTWQT
ncbi:DinB family protein [Paenibacillus caui]|uniref:DinB family protein n=1 Tax=Paenibacillus caui TaxID=2873927 RepID=UPI001CA9EE30|nr:DinB family protein [Paenibacillus caui]